jgi:BirA family transcriptional regulator, biotin operon repressor / biotin---[acetyl-CoA-carboxylase] ligase
VTSARFGRPHRHYRVTDSTNERARELAATGAPSGTVVTAGEQSAGRGRRGRRWSAPAGAALLYSAILRPLDRGDALLPLAAPLAVCDAIESIAPVECRVKWPNDVWIEERKVAGVLIEARPPEWAVIGVGVNVSVADDGFPAGLRWPATSVGHGVTPDAARRALDSALEEWVEADTGSVLGEFERRDALRGRSVSWKGAGDQPDGSGTAEGIDDHGNLVVITDAGDRFALGAGEVSLRPRRDAAY